MRKFKKTKFIFLSMVVCQSLLYGWTETETQNRINSNYFAVNALNSTVNYNHENRIYNLKNNDINQIWTFLEGGEFTPCDLEGSCFDTINYVGLENEVNTNKENSQNNAVEIENNYFFIEEVQEEVREALGYTDENRTDIDTNIIEIDKLKDKDAVLESLIFSNSTDINTNTSKNVEQDNRLDTHRTDINTNTNKNVELDNRLVIQRTDINTNTVKISNIRAINSAIIDNVDNNSNRLNNHAERLNTHDKRFDNLENQLKQNAKNENKKIAASMATNFNHNFSNGNHSISSNVAVFNGEMAVGFGYGYKGSESNTTSFNVGVNGGNYGFKINNTYSFSF